ncbi:receptor-like cytosolic serine/threonine-protein kinase RBK1 [Nymphaea colorata]|nr:receptor-like cytosolic serine/threonine-protein kinase RBK1 [Nymphaea colorata]
MEEIAGFRETNMEKEEFFMKYFNSDSGTNEHGSPRTVVGGSALVLYSDDSRSTSSSSSRGSAASVEKPTSSERSQWRTLFHMWKTKSMRRLATFPPVGYPPFRRKNPRRIVARRCPSEEDDAGALGAFSISKPSWRSFDYDELASATDNFSTERLLGKGGHAEVYRGCLADGQLVAIKRLTKGSSEEERVGDFLSELGIIAHIDHPNAARLIGFGIEGGLHLVLQFSPHGSLASMLQGSKRKMEWGIRYKIALGIAEGLTYLHEGCQRRIIHRDIKASNILLTEDYQPQISDFGLAKWLPENWTHHVVSPIEGTFGYMSPEYFMHGIVDEKIDVFAFGVLLLELITGRRAVDSCRQSLLMWAKPLLGSKNVRELADPSLGTDYDRQEMEWAVSTASMCVHYLAASRPRMSQVASLLRGERSGASAEPMGKGAQRKPSSGRTLLLNASDVDEYSSSRYLNDLNRYEQLALEF